MTTSEAIEVIAGIFSIAAPFSLIWAIAIRTYQFIIDCMTGRDVLGKRR